MTRHLVEGALELGEAEALAVEVAGKEIAVCRSEGQLHAISNVCTHQYALLSDGYIEDGTIECPMHQARFDLKTGAALSAPASEPVKVYRVLVEDGKAWVDVEP